MKTINTKILALMLVLALAACGNQNPPAETTEPEVSMTESDKLNEWFEVKYEEELMMSPIGLTFLGRKERYDEIDDMTEAAEDEQLEWKRQTVEEMKASFDYAALTDDAKLSYNLWAHQYEQSKNAVPFRRNDYVFTQMQGIHTFLPTLLLSFHKVEEVSDMDALISRVSGVGVAMNQLVDRAKLGAEEGVRPPRFSYEIVTTQAQDVISGAPFDDSETDSSLWGGIKGSVAALQEAGDIDEAQANAYLESAKTALIDNLKPSYENLISFMQADIANTSEEAQGASALPNGDAYYANQLAIRTTTDMTADEVHQLGLSEVTRIRAEMEELKQKAGFEGTLQEYFTYIRDNKDSEEHYYPNTDEGRQGYIDDATASYKPWFVF